MADERELALYLTLAPEFGATRFGPFEGAEVRLGHHEDNDITLPEALGVLDFHVKVLREPGMGLIVAPVERAAGVFVWKGQAHRPAQIHAPVAVQSGDAFALVTEAGPKFFVEIARLPEELLAKRRGLIGGNRELSKGAMADEVKRQTFAGISRRTLDEMLAQAPKKLPGALVHVGRGKERRHLRWDEARLDEWMAASQQWRHRRGRRRGKPVAAPRPAPPSAGPRRSVLAMVSDADR